MLRFYHGKPDYNSQRPLCVQEAAKIHRGFDNKSIGSTNGLSFGDPWPSKQLQYVVFIKHLFNRFCFYLSASIAYDFSALILMKFNEIRADKATFQAIL
jgi:hypothetical protein